MFALCKKGDGEFTPAAVTFDRVANKSCFSVNEAHGQTNTRHHLFCLESKLAKTQVLYNKLSRSLSANLEYVLSVYSDEQEVAKCSLLLPFDCNQFCFAKLGIAKHVSLVCVGKGDKKVEVF